MLPPKKTSTPQFTMLVKKGQHSVPSFQFPKFVLGQPWAAFPICGILVGFGWAFDGLLVAIKQECCGVAGDHEAAKKPCKPPLESQKALPKTKLTPTSTTHINTPKHTAFRESLAGDWIQFCWPKPSTVGG